MTPRMLLWRTRVKSPTVTLWLMSITASSPATAGRHDEDAMAGPGGGAWGMDAGAGGAGCRPLQPARDGPVNPASPANMLRREIIKPGIPCCGFDRSPPELTTHDLGWCENPQLGKAGHGGIDPVYAPGAAARPRSAATPRTRRSACCAACAD